VRIVLRVGPEVLAGSTRLKAGTATKLTLNMLTLGAMVQLGKVYGNLMVDLRPTSRKLRARALSILRTLARCSERDAARYLRSAHGRTKVAVLMARQGLGLRAAQRRLARAHGSLRTALTNRRDTSIFSGRNRGRK
jgi:N-acetylmuramic acid 6-phosphate etherase